MRDPKCGSELRHLHLTLFLGSLHASRAGAVARPTELSCKDGTARGSMDGCEEPHDPLVAGSRPAAPTFLMTGVPT